jgi:hypothetical protein
MSNAEWPYSWRKPISIYDSDGPELALGVTHTEVVLGVPFEIARTGDVGIDTGRDRFRVVCGVCGEELHRGTTRPSSHIDGHLREAHKVTP